MICSSSNNNGNYNDRDLELDEEDYQRKQCEFCASRTAQVVVFLGREYDYSRLQERRTKLFMCYKCHSHFNDSRQDGRQFPYRELKGV